MYIYTSLFQQTEIPSWMWNWWQNWKLKPAKFDEYVYSYYSTKFHSQKTIRENRMKMDSAHMEMRVGSFIFRHELDATYTELNKWIGIMCTVYVVD